MHRVGCPALAENAAAHREFAQKLEGWFLLLSMSGTPVSLLLDVQREASHWIAAHIVQVDCKLRGCRKVAAELPPPPSA